MIAIAIELGAPLDALPGLPTELERGVRDDVDALLRELGLRGEVAVTVARAAIGRPVRLRVRGQVRRYPPGALWRAWNDACGPLPAGPADARGFPAGWLRVLCEERPDAAAAAAPTAVRALVGELLRAAPGCLVGAEQAEAYGAGLGPGELAQLLDAGVSLERRAIVEQTVAAGREAGRTDDDILEGVLRRLRSDVIELRVEPAFGAALLGIDALDGACGALDERLPEAVRAPFEELRTIVERRPGIPCPEAVWVPDGALAPGHVALGVNDCTGPPVRIPGPGELVSDVDPARLARGGVHVVPLDKPLLIVAADAAQELGRLDAEAWTGPQFAALLVADAVVRHPGRLLTAAETEQQLAQLSRYYPELVEDVLERFRLPDLTRLLRRLIAGGAPIGNLRAVLHRLVLFDDVATGIAPDRLVLADLLPDCGGDACARHAAFVRLGMGEELLDGYVAPRRAVTVAGLELQPEAGAGAEDELLDAVWNAYRDMPAGGVPVFTTGMAEREAVHALVASEVPSAGVLAWQELPPARTIIDLTREGAALDALESLTRSRVEEMLERELTDADVVAGEDGDFAVELPEGSVHVRVLRHGELAFVLLAAIAATDVAATPALHRWAATAVNAIPFGRARVIEHGETADIVIEHELLGNCLDSAELVCAIYGVTANARERVAELALLAS